MAKFIVKRLSIAAVRFIGIALILLVLMELSYCILGDNNRHVWEAASYSATVPEGMPHQGQNWVAVFSSHAAGSLLVLGIAFSVVILIGYGWGILGARMRRIGLIHYVTLPFGLLACIPGFWFITMVVVFTLFRWGRPGFADELSVSEGFDYLTLWHATVLAFPITFGMLCWQLKAVSKEICAKAAEPYVKALYIRGHRSEAIFYRNIFKQSISGLVLLFDKTLSPLMGALIAVEWAYRYPGIGTLLVESAREARFEGVFLTGIGMSSFIILMTLLREIVAHSLNSEKP